jgi:threonine/homoserine/homoserine lactone efflux protein
MFDYTLLHWLTFFGAALALNLSPGADIAFILGRTLQQGRRAGFAAMAGIWAGTLGHVALAALGLSAILATSASVFTVIKWVGAAYLIWLGIQALRSDGSGYLPGRKGTPVSEAKIFRQGFLINALNPKVAIFFLAFLPQFVVEGAGPVWAQLALHGVLILVVSAIVEPPLILLGDKLSRAIKARPQIGLWLDRMLGTLLIGLGAKLALSRT